MEYGAFLFHKLKKKEAQKLEKIQYREIRGALGYWEPASCRRRRKGNLKSETLKYGQEFQGTRTRERLRWQGPAAYTKDRSVLSSEREHPTKKIPYLSGSNKYLVITD
jgi:hypothetical protein